MPQGPRPGAQKKGMRVNILLHCRVPFGPSSNADADCSDTMSIAPSYCSMKKGTPTTDRPKGRRWLESRIPQHGAGCRTRDGFTTRDLLHKRPPGKVRSKCVYNSTPLLSRWIDWGKRAEALARFSITDLRCRVSFQPINPPYPLRR